MELHQSNLDLEPLPVYSNQPTHNKPLGILNSNYQRIVSFSYKKSNPSSLFGMKQDIKSKQFSTCCSVATILKVSLFVLAFLVAYI